jgi:hypothetical protein
MAGLTVKNVTPLEFLTAVYMNDKLPLPARMKAAIEAAQYVHPKLAVVATTHSSGDFGALLDRAIVASRAVREPKLIEATSVKPNGGHHRSPEEISTERMGKSFPMRRRI